MKTLTVITTTYNRAYCLHQVYESLLRQKSDDFIWLVVDDGSTDHTKELIDKWVSEGKIEIEYHYKSNGGMHTARNLAYEKVHTEINVIIDSDDWMAENAIEKIIYFWNANKREDIAGIIALNADPTGKIVGTKMPENISECHFAEFWGKYHMKGDKKLIYRSELTRLYPYPEFPDEKFFPPSYKFLMLDRKYKMLVLDEVVCTVDYNEDSMTRDKFVQYKNSPKGFAFYRNKMAQLSKNPKEIIRLMIHYIAESRLAGEKHYIAIAKRKIYALLCWIPGNILYLYLMKTKRKY